MRRSERSKPPRAFPQVLLPPADLESQKLHGGETEREIHMNTLFNGGRCAIPKPPQRFHKQMFLYWASKLKQGGTEVHALYEACGFGFFFAAAIA